MLPIWKTLGFALFVAIYYSTFDPAYNKFPSPGFKTALFKILPILHCILIVVSTSYEEDNLTKPREYRLSIALGLAASVGGDVALVWRRQCLVVGIACFATAHVLYTRAFRLRPVWSGPVAATFAVVGLTVYLFMVDGIKEGPEMKALLAVYIALIFTMTWRATVQFLRDPNVENGCACCGALAFTVSDFLVAVDLFKDSFQMAPFWIMITYYLAQLGIAMSAVNSTESKPYNFVSKKTE